MRTELIPCVCKAVGCGKYFHIDGDMRIGSQPCPHCGSNNIDHTTFQKLHFSLAGSEASPRSLVPRKLIIKVYGSVKNFNPLYFIGPEDGSDVKPAGTITAKILEAFHLEKLLTEIPVDEIIQTYPLHKWFLTDIKTSKFYELKTKSI